MLDALTVFEKLKKYSTATFFQRMTTLASGKQKLPKSFCCCSTVNSWIQLKLGVTPLCDEPKVAAKGYDMKVAGQSGKLAWKHHKSSCIILPSILYHSLPPLLMGYPQIMVIKSNNNFSLSLSCLYTSISHLRIILKFYLRPAYQQILHY